jgi:voltage-gated potassium channel
LTAPPGNDVLGMSPGTRAVLASVARALSTTAVVLALYFVMPFDREIDNSVALFLAIGMALLAAVITWQVWAILHAAHPGLRAIESLGVSIPLFLVLFSLTYLRMGLNDPTAFTQPMSRVNALYFTTTVFSTVGFGDIAARSDTARLVVTGQMAADLIVLGVGLRVITGAVKLGIERRSAGVPAATFRRREPRPTGEPEGPEPAGH